jgi:hypothetical protein
MAASGSARALKAGVARYGPSRKHTTGSDANAAVALFLATRKHKTKKYAPTRTHYRETQRKAAIEKATQSSD